MPESESGVFSDDQRRKVVWAVAFVVVLLTGIGFRALDARYARAHRSVPLPSGSLARFPLKVGDWTGQDIELDERVVRATDTDDHVNRMYRQTGFGLPVSFFVGYGLRLRDLAPHRPEVCYRGAGWTLVGSRVIDIDLPDGNVLTCGLQSFDKSGLQGRRLFVLNYYLVDGQSCEDVSLLRSRAWRFDTGTTYSAQVQVTADATQSPEAAEEAIIAFTREAAPVIRDVLNTAVEQAVARGENAS